MEEEEEATYISLQQFPSLSLRKGLMNASIINSKTITEVDDYIEEYFDRNKGFVPSNYAIGTKVVTA